MEKKGGAEILRIIDAVTNSAAGIAKAHKNLRLPEPTIEDILKYQKAGRNAPMESVAAQKYVNSLLDVRERPLPKSIKQERQDFADDILARMQEAVHIEEDKKTKKEFDGVAKSISRLISIYYMENEKLLKELDGTRLQTLLSYLAQHLLAEVELCIEARFTVPRKNLSKVSVFDIQEKLEMLQRHEDEVVRDNAKTIVYAALHKGNLSLADELADGAKKKLEMLQRHEDEIGRAHV